MRRFLDDIRSDMAALYVAGGGIEALSEGALMLDLLDSVIQDEGGIISTAQVLAVPTTTAFSPLTTVYDADLGGDAVFVKLDFAAGTVTSNAEAGFTYVINSTISFTDIGNNAAIDFVILQNGVPVGSEINETGRGTSRAIGLTIRAYINSAVANDVFTLGVRTPASAQTFDVLSCSLFATIQPTNNP